MATNKILVWAIIILFIGLIILGAMVFNMNKQIKTTLPAGNDNTIASAPPAPQKLLSKSV